VSAGDINNKSDGSGATPPGPVQAAPVSLADVHKILPPPVGQAIAGVESSPDDMVGAAPLGGAVGEAVVGASDLAIAGEEREKDYCDIASAWLASVYPSYAQATMQADPGLASGVLGPDLLYGFKARCVEAKRVGVMGGSIEFESLDVLKQTAFYDRDRDVYVVRLGIMVHGKAGNTNLGTGVFVPDHVGQWRETWELQALLNTHTDADGLCDNCGAAIELGVAKCPYCGSNTGMFSGWRALSLLSMS